jgi:acyl carrier protein
VAITAQETCTADDRPAGMKEDRIVPNDVEILAAEPAQDAPSVDCRAEPADGIEDRLGQVLAGVLRVEQVPGDSHFFDDLDADSMVMAQFCAKVRKRHDLPAVSMKDIYRHPTISNLATALAERASGDLTSVESAGPAASV